MASCGRSVVSGSGSRFCLIWLEIQMHFVGIPYFSWQSYVPLGSRAFLALFGRPVVTKCPGVVDIQFLTWESDFSANFAYKSCIKGYDTLFIAHNSFKIALALCYAGNGQRNGQQKFTSPTFTGTREPAFRCRVYAGPWSVVGPDQRTSADQRSAEKNLLVWSVPGPDQGTSGPEQAQTDQRTSKFTTLLKTPI